MAGHLRKVITASDAALRNESLDAYCREASLDDLLAECADLDRFRRESDNLYERVRALFFLYAIHRFHMPQKPGLGAVGRVPYEGYQRLLIRRFDEAISCFQTDQQVHGPSDAISSALATAYHQLAFQTLADQVRRSVRGVRGNQWMFRVGHPADHPLRLRHELLQRPKGRGPYPVLHERTPVRMDLSHSAWSDIFFLGMDYPEGARVLNVSIDLGVHGRDAAPKPPVEVYLRVIDEPVLRLVSVDLGASADITSLAEVFDFARDYLGLLKAAIIAAGIVPPGLEGSEQDLRDLLARLVGPGLGLEVVSSVNDIPKGSRLAVSTNLLASLISACMRATGQARSLTGILTEEERQAGGSPCHFGRVAGRLRRRLARFGRHLAGHQADRRRAIASLAIRSMASAAAVFCRDTTSSTTTKLRPPRARVCRIASSSFTAAWLKTSARSWRWSPRNICCGPRGSGLRANRHSASSTTCSTALRTCDVHKLGASTTRNFQRTDPDHHSRGRAITTPRPSSTVAASILAMISGASGCSAGCRAAAWGSWSPPRARPKLRSSCQRTMSTAKASCEQSLPFAMEPVVYDFAINPHGTFADVALRRGGAAAAALLCHASAGLAAAGSAAD